MSLCVFRFKSRWPCWLTTSSPSCSLIHIVVIVTRSRSAVTSSLSCSLSRSVRPTVSIVIRLESRLLGHCSFLVLKDPDHVACAATCITWLEVLETWLAWGQQEHHTVAQKAHASALLLTEIVNVLLELALLSVILRNKGYNTLHRILVHVLKVCAMWHVQIVILVTQVAHNVRLFEVPYHVRLHKNPVRLVSSHEARPHITVIIFKNVFSFGPQVLLVLLSCPDKAYLGQGKIIYCLIFLFLLIFLPQ